MNFRKKIWKEVISCEAYYQYQISWYYIDKFLKER